MFNLETLAVKDSAFLQLRHPATDELLFDGTEKVGINLFSTSSKQYRDAINAMQNRQLKRGKKTASAEVMREESVALLAAVSKDAQHFDYYGAPINSTEVFVKLYSDEKFGWIKSQVDDFLGDYSGFLEK